MSNSADFWSTAVTLLAELDLEFPVVVRAD